MCAENMLIPPTLLMDYLLANSLDFRELGNTA